jgi:hypothetical protein
VARTRQASAFGFVAPGAITGVGAVAQSQGEDAPREEVTSF